MSLLSSSSSSSKSNHHALLIRSPSFPLVLLLLLSISLQPHTLYALSTRSSPIQELHPIRSSNLRLLPRLISPNHDQHQHQQDRRPLSSTLLRRSTVAPHPSQLAHNDSLLLRFSIPSSSSSPSSSFSHHTFTLSLRPTLNLIHPNAVINYYTHHPQHSQTVLSHQSPLREEDVLAYSGWVIHPDHLNSWWDEELASVHRHPDHATSTYHHDKRVLGWARIIIHDRSRSMKDEDDHHRLVFEGSFTSNHTLWHVKPTESFQRIRSGSDPMAEHQTDHLAGGLLAWAQELSEDSDDHLRGHIPPPSSCTHDQLSFNSDPLHPVYQTGDSYQQQQPFGFTSPYALPSNGLATMSTLLDTLFGLPVYHRPPSGSISYSHASSSSYLSRPSSRLVRRQSLTNDMSALGNSSSSSNFVNSIGMTTGCPVGNRVVFIGVAADCTYVSKHGSQDNARTAILNNVNSASALYQRSFNVSLGVVELNVQAPNCPSTPSSGLPWNIGCPESGPNGLDLNSRLSAFSQWRGDKGGSDGAGLWHLMTNCSTGSEVGVAWLGQLCQTASRVSSSGQVTSGTGVTASTTSEWQVMAHEIGHNFGAIHDCASGCSLSGACCPLSSTSCNTNGNFVMSPVATKPATAFSPCSLGNVCTTLKNTLNTTCLVTPGQRTVISLKQCGNGIVEPGEDCDPGQNSNSTCCDPTTCKFSSGSICDPSNGGCCTNSCQFSSAGTVCRPSVNSECDKVETCPGNSASCPKDEFEQNGKKCGIDGAGLSCAGGLCTSRDEQCKNQGSSLRLTKSCAPSATMDCSISCVDPTGRADCIILSTNFVDGTECGYGGRCSGGSCKSGDLKDTALSWFRSNLGISIPIVVGAGLLALLLVFWVLRCCSESARRVMSRKPKTRAEVGQGYLVDHQPPGGLNNRQNWVDPAAWNGR